MSKTGKTKAGAGAAKAPAAPAKATRNRQSAGTKLAELKRRLLEISDLAAAGAVLGWDQSTYAERRSSRAGSPECNAQQARA
jgi:hypothetical protein